MSSLEFSLVERYLSKGGKRLQENWSQRRKAGKRDQTGWFLVVGIAESFGADVYWPCRWRRISSGSDSAQTSATNVVSGAAALGIDAVCEVRRVGLNQRIAHGATSVAAELEQE
jgi:hypothetical protein